jgi:ABC-type phosphate transport system substrate-binding protein
LRVAIYIVILAALFFLRGKSGWERMVSHPRKPAGADSTLRIAGVDLAPVLIYRLADHYRSEYPRILPTLDSGGTHHALQALLEGGADVGFLARPPLASEQALFRAQRGDTLAWFPVGVGGLVLLRGAGVSLDTLSVDGLRTRLARGPDAGIAKLYVPDPNSGIWSAFTEALRLPAESIATPIVFLRDVAEVVDAVRVDELALGVVSSLNLPEDVTAGGVSRVSVLSSRTAAPAAPTFEEIGVGNYPLFHYLIIAIPERGTREGGKFVTFVTSAHGQRMIKRAGFLPAWHMGREVYLTAQSPSPSR